MECNLIDRIIIYTDAAFFPSTGKTAFGYVVQYNENILLAGACSGRRKALVQEGKVSAVLWALRKAKELGFSKLHILSDA